MDLRPKHPVGKLWFTLLVLSLVLAGCGDKNYRSIHELPRRAELVLPSGKKLTVDLALSMREKLEGLSGIQARDYADDRGMLFVYWDYAPRRIWMPDTYFDLDIFFLNKHLKILDVQRHIPHHPGRQNPSSIPTSRTVRSAHLLEIKSVSSLAKELKPGDTLRWSSEPPFNTYEKVMRATKY